MFLKVLALLPDRRPRASNSRHLTEQWTCPAWRRATHRCPRDPLAAGSPARLSVHRPPKPPFRRPRFPWLHITARAFRLRCDWHAGGSRCVGIQAAVLNSPASTERGAVNTIDDAALIEALRQQMTKSVARQVAAAGNLANVDTPNYKAVEPTFADALKGQLADEGDQAGSHQPGRRRQRRRCARSGRRGTPRRQHRGARSRAARR